METALKKKTYEYMTPVWDGTVGRETAEEYVVPDTMPDVGTIVDAEGILTLRSKDTAAGYVQLSATASVSVVYSPEGGGPMRSLELSLPADIRADAPGVDEECSSVVRVRLRSVEARAVNSRKIAVRADVEANIRCCRRVTMEIPDQPVDDSDAVHILPGAAETVTIADIREKTFAVTDEYAFPADCSGEESVLARRMEALVEDVQYVGGKAVFRGRVRSELLFSDTESGKVAVGRYETEFSQIMEIGSVDGDALPEITLFTTGVYYDLPEYGRETGRIAAEIHLGAQCICRERSELAYIADIYSNRTELVPTTEELSFVRDVRAVSLRQTLVGRVESFPGEGDVLQTTALVGGLDIQEGTVKTSVNIRLIYRKPDGGYDSARCRLAADFTPADIPAGAALENVSVVVEDVYGGAGGDVRVVLQMNASAVEKKSITCVREVREDPEAWQARERTPSMTLIRVPENADLWTLARRYHSTVEAIKAANEGRKGGLLLVPKGR